MRLDQDLTDHTSLTVKAYHQDYHGHGSTYKADPAGWYLTANKPIDRLINDYSVTYHSRKKRLSQAFCAISTITSGRTGPIIISPAPRAWSGRITGSSARTSI